MPESGRDGEIVRVDVATERQHVELRQGIEQFSAEQLRPVSTEEKIILPSKEGDFIVPVGVMRLRFAEIAQEKVRELAAKYNHGDLNHVEPTVKTGLPTKEGACIFVSRSHLVLKSTRGRR